MSGPPLWIQRRRAFHLTRGLDSLADEGLNRRAPGSALEKRIYLI